MEISGNLGELVPVVGDVLSQEPEKKPHTLLNEHCTEFDVQTDQNNYVELRRAYFALQLKFVKSGGYKSQNNRELEKEHNDEAKAVEKTEEKQESPNFLVTHVKTLCTQFSSNLMCTLTISRCSL